PLASLRRRSSSSLGCASLEGRLHPPPTLIALNASHEPPRAQPSLGVEALLELLHHAEAARRGSPGIDAERRLPLGDDAPGAAGAPVRPSERPAATRPARAAGSAAPTVEPPTVEPPTSPATKPIPSVAYQAKLAPLSAPRIGATSASTASSCVGSAVTLAR